MSMTADDWERIRELIHLGIKEALEGERVLLEFAINKHENSEEYQAFRAFMVREANREKRYEKIVTSAIGAIVIGTLLWVGTHVIEIAAWIVRTAK
jgi:hypothetical protein